MTSSLCFRSSSQCHTSFPWTSMKAAFTLQREPMIRLFRCVMGNVRSSFGCFYCFLLYIDRFITIQYFYAPVLFYHCYFWPVPSFLSLKFWPRVNFRLWRRSRGNNRDRNLNSSSILLLPVFWLEVSDPPRARLWMPPLLMPLKFV